MELHSSQSASQPSNTARRELLEKFGRFAALTPTAMLLLPAESQAGDKGHKGKPKPKPWHHGKGDDYH